MRARSPKRARQMREYGALVGPFLEAHEWCEFPLGCGDRSQVVHHQRGRFGLRLLDQTYWAASCNTHNGYAEDHTGHSLEIGWLLRIEGVTA